MYGNISTLYLTVVEVELMEVESHEQLFASIVAERQHGVLTQVPAGIM